MSTVTKAAAEQHKYQPVPLHTLNLTQKLPVDVYLIREKDAPPVLFRKRNIGLSSKDFTVLQNNGIETVHILREQCEEYQAYLSENVGSIVEHSDIPMEHRLQFLGATGRTMLKQVFQTDDIDETMEAVGNLSTYMTSLFAENDVVVSELFDVLRHDYHTYNHVYNVASYSLLLAKELGVSDQNELRAISMGGLLHDLGKLAIPINILNKTDRLSDQDWAIIKRHPTDGFIALADRPELSKEQLMMVYQHHEKLDGSGYPVGIEADEIHFYARVCSVVDIFEALTANRPYRNPASKKEAFEILDRLSTSKLDKEMVQCWKSAMN